MLTTPYKEHEIQFYLEWDFTSNEQIKIMITAYDEGADIFCDVEEGTFGLCYPATQVSVFAIFQDEIQEAINSLDIHPKHYKGTSEDSPESDISDYEYYSSKF